MVVNSHSTLLNQLHMCCTMDAKPDAECCRSEMLAGHEYCKPWRKLHRRAAWTIAAHATTKVLECITDAHRLVDNIRKFESLALQRICSLPLAGAAGSAAHARSKGCELSLRPADEDRRMKMIAQSEIIRPCSTFSDQRIWLMSMPKNYRGRQGLLTLLADAGSVHKATTWPCSWASFDAGWRAVHCGALRITCHLWVREAGPRLLRAKAAACMKGKAWNPSAAAAPTRADIANHLLERATSIEAGWQSRRVFDPLLDSLWLIASDDTVTRDTMPGRRDWATTPPFTVTDIPVRERSGTKRRASNELLQSVDAECAHRSQTFSVRGAIVRANLWPWTRDSHCIWSLFVAAVYLKGVWVEAGWDITDRAAHLRRLREHQK